MAKRILSLDAGFAALGWAVIEGGKILECGVLRTQAPKRMAKIRAADANAERTMFLIRSLRDIVVKYEVKGLLAEMPSGGAQSAAAMACMARAATIPAALAGFFDLPREWISPADVKVAATATGFTPGSKTASKQEVKDGVLRRWPQAKLPVPACAWEHTADALGVYLAAEHGQLVTMLNV